MLSKTKFDKLAEKSVTELTTAEFQTVLSQAITHAVLEANAEERKRRGGEFTSFLLLSIVFVVVVGIISASNSSIAVIAFSIYAIFVQYWMFTRWL